MRPSPSVRKPAERDLSPRESENPPSRPATGRLVVNDPAYLSFLLARISGGRRRRSPLRKAAD
jgi:hypothetical protein